MSGSGKFSGVARRTAVGRTATVNRREKDVRMARFQLGVGKEALTLVVRSVLGEGMVRDRHMPSVAAAHPAAVRASI
jgi:hypothetical protein